MRGSTPGKSYSQSNPESWSPPETPRRGVRAWIAVAALVDALLEAYFSDGRNLNEHEELAAVAAGAGLDADEIRSYLAGDEGKAEVRASQEEAYAKGYKVCHLRLRRRPNRLRRSAGGGVPSDPRRRARGARRLRSISGVGYEDAKRSKLSGAARLVVVLLEGV